MMMHCLATAGIEPFADNNVSYEHPEVLQLAEAGTFHGVDLMGKLGGKCVKVVDPMTFKLPHPKQVGSDVSYRIIWMARDHEQIARSQVKLIGDILPLLNGSELFTSEQLGVMVDVLKRDEHAFLSKAVDLMGPSCRVHVTRFEELLSSPHLELAKVFVFLGIEPDIIQREKVERAAATIIDRSPECQPDLRIEEELRAQREGRS